MCASNEPGDIGVGPQRVPPRVTIGGKPVLLSPSSSSRATGESSHLPLHITVEAPGMTDRSTAPQGQSGTPRASLSLEKARAWLAHLLNERCSSRARLVAGAVVLAAFLVALPVWLARRPGHSSQSL